MAAAEILIIIMLVIIICIHRGNRDKGSRILHNEVNLLVDVILKYLTTSNTSINSSYISSSTTKTRSTSSRCINLSL